MTNEITVTISGKDNVSDVFEDSGKAAKNYGDKVGDLGDKADEAEKRTLGLKDTIDGVGAIMQGPHGKQGLGGYIQGWADLAGGVANFVVPSIKSAARGIMSLATQSGRAALMANIHKGAQLAGAAATRVLTLAQRGLNAAMRANPIGIIITVLALLVAGFIYAYKHSEKFRTIVNAVWKAIKTAAVTAWNFIKGIPEGIKTVFAKGKDLLVNGGRRILLGLLSGIREKHADMIAYVRAVPGKIRDRFVNVNVLLLRKGMDIINGLRRGISNKWGDLVTYVKALPGKLRDRFVKANVLLYNAGRRIIGGLKDGVVDKMAGIGDWVKRKIVNPIIGAVKKFFGIKSPSTVFAGMGKHLVGGLLSGMMSAGNGGAIARKVFGSMPNALKAIVGKGLQGVKNLTAKARTALGMGSTGGTMASGGSWMGGTMPLLGARTSRHGSGYPWAQYAGDFNRGSGGEDYGDPVRAWQSGFIASTQRWGHSYGNHIRMRHQSANTLYAHLSSIWVKPGQYVGQGQVIGQVGSSGNSSGPHLHWEKYGKGGVINEPIYGIGASSGRGYLFGEAGPETITPGVGGGGGTTVIELHVGDQYLGRFVGQQIREHDRGARRKVMAGDNGGF